MKKENLILIAVIGGVILLGIGFYLGLIYTQKQIEKTQIESPLTTLLASKVINGLKTIASGEVKEISSRNLTLSKDGDTLTVSIREDAPIYRIVPPEEVTEIPQPIAREEIKFEEIKVGDKVSISCQLKTDATLEGNEVTILP